MHRCHFEGFAVVGHESGIGIAVLQKRGTTAISRTPTVVGVRRGRYTTRGPRENNAHATYGRCIPYTESPSTEVFLEFLSRDTVRLKSWPIMAFFPFAIGNNLRYIWKPQLPTTVLAEGHGSTLFDFSVVRVAARHVVT